MSSLSFKPTSQLNHITKRKRTYYRILKETQKYVLVFQCAQNDKFPSLIHLALFTDKVTDERPVITNSHDHNNSSNYQTTSSVREIDLIRQVAVRLENITLIH